MLHNPELGYTPNNLRRLLTENNITQKDAREHIGKGRNTFSRYLYNVDNRNHVGMSHKSWLKLVDLAKKQVHLV